MSNQSPLRVGGTCTSVKRGAVCYVVSTTGGNVLVNYEYFPFITPREGDAFYWVKDQYESVKWNGKEYAAVKTPGRFKSIAEARLAAVLEFNGITYDYERAYVIDLGFPYHPDFYLPQFDAYVELWGMAHIEGPVGDRYRAQMARKRAWHQANRTNLIEVYLVSEVDFKIQLTNQLTALTGIKAGGLGSFMALVRQAEDEREAEALEVYAYLK